MVSTRGPTDLGSSAQWLQDADRQADGPGLSWMLLMDQEKNDEGSFVPHFNEALTLASQRGYTGTHTVD